MPGASHFQSAQEAIFRKPAYTYRSAKARKEFILMVPFFTPLGSGISTRAAASPFIPKLPATSSPRSKYQEKRLQHQKAIANADRLLARPPLSSVHQTPAHLPAPVALCISLWEKTARIPNGDLQLWSAMGDAEQVGNLFMESKHMRHLNCNSCTGCFRGR